VTLNNATLSPGETVGILTVTNAVILGGTTFMELNNSLSPNSDRIVATNITYGGTLTVANVGPALAANQTFQLFSGSRSGSFATVNLPAYDANGMSYTWTNKLGVDGTIQVLTATSGVNTSRTNITILATTTNTVVLSWPADHLGWHLQAQTNAARVGLGTNWATVAGSQTNTQMILPVGVTNGSVFFRLAYP
jgi:hypothetical protein